MHFLIVFHAFIPSLPTTSQSFFIFPSLAIAHCMASRVVSDFKIFPNLLSKSNRLCALIFKNILCICEHIWTFFFFARSSSEPLLMCRAFLCCLNGHWFQTHKIFPQMKPIWIDLIINYGFPPQKWHQPHCLWHKYFDKPLATTPGSVCTRPTTPTSKFESHCFLLSCSIHSHMTFSSKL